MTFMEKEDKLIIKIAVLSAFAVIGFASTLFTIIFIIKLWITG